MKRIAVNLGGSYVPGLNAVVTGTVLAAHELGWEVVGIRDGFGGLPAPERMPMAACSGQRSWNASPRMGTLSRWLGTCRS